MLKRWFTLLLIAMLPILAKAQSGTVYPIDLSVTMTPPYGTCLKEYVGSDRIVIQALLKDFSKTSDQFVIQLKVTDNRNRVVFLSWFGDYEFKPGEVFTFPMGPNASPVQKSNVLHDLFDPTHASVKLRNECFDEGAYTFTFQAFERASYPARKIALSLPFSYPVFLQGNTVQPLQIYPYENDVICNKAYEYLVDADNDIKKFATQLGGISYQWQSANPTGMRVGYHLQVVDLGDIENRLEKDIRESAQSAFSKNSYFPVNEIVFTPFYNHTITSTDYSENHAYAWRVRAVTGNSLTESLTYSKEQLSSVNDNAPVRVFYFCGAPGVEKDTFNLVLDERVFNDKLHQVKMDTIKASNLTANAFWRDSTVKDGYCGVNVEIRKKGQEKWTPYFVEKSMDLDADGNAVDNSHNFENLSYNTRYEVRAQYVQCKECTDRSKDCVYAPYSDVKEFLIPSPIDSAVCGDNLPKLTSCEEGVKVPKILAGDTIYANGAKVVVDEVSYPNASDSSIISGTAHLSMPIVKNIQLKMSFSEIQINCAKELVKGKIKSIWDEQTCAMINLDELTGQSSTGGKDNTPSEAKTDTYSSDPEELKKKPAGELLVDGDKVYLKTDNETGAVEIGTMVSLSAQEYQSKNYLAENSHYIEFYNTDKVNNAFDNDSAGWYRKMSQYDYFDAPNNKVILPWLANNPGKIKHIKAREVKKKETIPSFESVMFVIPSGGSYIQLKAEKEIVSKMGKNDTVYDLTVPGWADVTHSTPIFAIARKSDTSSFNDAGKMMVANYAERTHKLNIVSLVGELDNSYKTEAEKALNSIYGKLGVKYEVELSTFDDETINDLLLDGLSIGADGESRWKVETQEMKQIRKKFAEKNTIEKKAAYLFVVNHPEEAEYKKSVDGDMPRNQSVGYLFKDNIKSDLGRLVAHEIGHGVYKFQHTFDYKELPNGSTDNLMDYNGGDYLAHYQWRVMQDSVMFVWGILQDDEDAFDAKKEAIKCASKQIGKAVLRKCGDKFLKGQNWRDLNIADFYDIMVQSGNGIKSECVTSEEVKKIFDVLEKLVSCYIESNTEQELDYCLCEVFTQEATGMVTGIAEAIYESLKESLAENNPVARQIVDDLEERYKEDIDQIFEKFNSTILTTICGSKPKSTPSPRYERDHFEVTKGPCGGGYISCTVDIVTAVENPLNWIIATTTDGDGKVTITTYDKIYYSPNISIHNDIKNEGVLARLLPISEDGKPGIIYMDSWDIYTWMSILGGFKFDDKDGLGTEADGRYHYYYTIKVPCPKNGEIQLRTSAKMYRNAWPRFNNIDNVVNGVKDLWDWSMGQKGDNNVPKDSVDTKLFFCCDRESKIPEEEKKKTIVYYSDICTNSRYDDSYTKNPAGTSTKSEVDATKKRREMEVKYDVPKCSGWTKENGKFTYASPFICDGPYRAKKLYEIKGDKAIIDPKVAQNYLYKTFVFWGDDISDKNLVTKILVYENKEYKMVELNDFITKIMSSKFDFMMDLYAKIAFMAYMNSETSAAKTTQAFKNAFNEVMSIDSETNVCYAFENYFNYTATVYPSYKKDVKYESAEFFNTNQYAKLFVNDIIGNLKFSFTKDQYLQAFQECDGLKGLLNLYIKQLESTPISLNIPKNIYDRATNGYKTLTNQFEVLNKVRLRLSNGISLDQIQTENPQLYAAYQKAERYEKKIIDLNVPQLDDICSKEESTGMYVFRSDIELKDYSYYKKSAKNLVERDSYTNYEYPLELVEKTDDIENFYYYTLLLSCYDKLNNLHSVFLNRVQTYVWYTRGLTVFQNQNGGFRQCRQFCIDKDEYFPSWWKKN